MRGVISNTWAMGLALAALTTVVAGCGDDDGVTAEPGVVVTTSAVPPTVPAQEPPGPLDGGGYRATTLTVDGHEQAAVGGTAFTISFEGGSVVATAGCNTMRSGYRIEGDRLVAGPLASTRKGCPPELEAQDQLMIELLSGSPALLQTPEALTLTGERITFTGSAP